MYTQKVIEVRSDGKKVVEASWLAEDKIGGRVPTADIANGSDGVEMDTGKVYLFDESGGAWSEVVV